MIYAIIGSRSFSDYDLLCETLEGKNITGIVSGGAKGADSLAERYAIENSIGLTVCYPNWAMYGKSAGMIRNKDIIKKSDAVVAFWDGTSKGTAHAVHYADSLEKPVIVVGFNIPEETKFESEFF